MAYATQLTVADRQKTFEAELKALWTNARKLVKADGRCDGFGDPTDKKVDFLNRAVAACWGDWNAEEKPYREAWNGQECPAEFVMPDPAATPIGSAVAAQAPTTTSSDGDWAGRTLYLKRGRDQFGRTKWGREVEARLSRVQNLPEARRTILETKPGDLARYVWAQCVQIEGEKSSGGKAVVGMIIDKMVKGRAIERVEASVPTNNGGGRKKLDIHAPGYVSDELKALLD